MTDEVLAPALASPATEGLPPDTIIPLVVVSKYEPTTGDHHGGDVNELSETEPERKETPPPARGRLKAAGTFVARRVGAALDRVLVLLLALTALALLKGCAVRCGVPLP